MLYLQLSSACAGTVLLHLLQSHKQEHVLVSSTSKDFQTVYEEEIGCLCTVTFDQKSLKLNSSLVLATLQYKLLKIK